MNQPSQSYLQKPLWHIRSLILSHLLAGFLVLTTMVKPLHQILWKPLDTGAARLLTSCFVKSPFWQNFWAFANHRMGDALEDVFFLLFFLWLILLTPKGLKRRKAAEFFFLAFLTAAVVLLVNNFLFKQVVHITRWSPSLMMDGLPSLSNYVSWIKVKSGSKASFPSDHATTAVMFMANFFILTKNRMLRVCVGLYGAFLCCPRMVAGAHWITDILCGSVSVVLIVYSWALFSPLAARASSSLDRFFAFTSNLFQIKTKRT